MKVKTIRYKAEPKEFIHIGQIGGDPIVSTGAFPKLHGIDCTLDDLKEYYDGLEMDWDKIEMIELDIIESGVVGADIRNKLTPPNNLVAMLEHYFNPKISHVSEERRKLAELIKKEMKNTKKSVEYIKDLF